MGWLNDISAVVVCFIHCNQMTQINRVRDKQKGLTSTGISPTPSAQIDKKSVPLFLTATAICQETCTYVCNVPK
jgi:hypothetical protein